MKLNINTVDLRSLEVEGINTHDYPDFCDAFISAGCHLDGTDLTDDELDELNDHHSALVYDLVLERLF